MQNRPNGLCPLSTTRPATSSATPRVFLLHWRLDSVSHLRSGRSPPVKARLEVLRWARRRPLLALPPSQRGPSCEKGTTGKVSGRLPLQHIHYHCKCSAISVLHSPRPSSSSSSFFVALCASSGCIAPICAVTRHTIRKYIDIY